MGNFQFHDFNAEEIDLLQEFEDHAFEENVPARHRFRPDDPNPYDARQRELRKKRNTGALNKQLLHDYDPYGVL